MIFLPVVDSKSPGIDTLTCILEVVPGCLATIMKERGHMNIVYANKINEVGPRRVLAREAEAIVLFKSYWGWNILMESQREVATSNEKYVHRPGSPNPHMEVLPPNWAHEGRVLNDTDSVANQATSRGYIIPNMPGGMIQRGLDLFLPPRTPCSEVPYKKPAPRLC